MSQRTGVLRRVLANPGLRRVELSFLAFIAAEYGVWLSVLVYAYERGGASAAGAIAVLQLLPAAIVAPLAANLADRRGGAVALRIGYLVQTGSIGFAGAAILLHAPPAVVYAGAITAASAVTLTRPAQGALLPLLVRTPEELTAANVVTGWVESLGLLVGPGLAGALIAIDGAGLALAAFAGTLVSAALLVAPLAARPLNHATANAEQPAGAPKEMVRMLRAEPGVTAALALIAMQFVAEGALDVLEVVLALAVLGIGPGGAGLLGAAFGAGALIGAIASIGLIGRARLATPLLAGAVGWGVAFVTLGAWPAVSTAVVLLAGAGASRTVLEVSGRTVLHRTVPARMHGRVFGVLEGIAMLGLAAGSLLVPVIVAAAGARAALVVVGGLLLLAAFATKGTLRALERSAPDLATELTVLRASPLFSMLAAPVLEDLAGALIRRQAAPGQAVIREGEPGERFYLLASGEVAVTVAGHAVPALQPMQGFGEIALLRDGIRTATVTAKSAVTLYALERPPFLSALTGSYHARCAADELMALHLGT